jgi:tetratricopeptide (TPR) repeat protein
MSKKKQPKRITPINLPRRLREGLEEADSLISEGKPREALEQLRELDGKFPHQPDVLGLMANAYLDTGDQHGYLLSIYKLHGVTPNKAEIKAGLAGAYLFNGHLALALQTFRQFVQRWPNDERAGDARKTIAHLEGGLADMLGNLGLSGQDGFDFACRHEEMRLHMELGNYNRCRQLSKTLLEERPHFTPLLNNLSLMEWLEGRLPEAIEFCQKVLDLEPENVHALANLTRFLFMQGRKDEVYIYAQRLKLSQAAGIDIWIKKAEALSFIGDDDGVLALIEQAKLVKEQKELNGLFWHWCAVAAYRNGNTTKARSYWRKSVQDPQSVELAQTNLDELAKPVYERTCPQAFGIETWLSRKTIEAMSLAVERAAKYENDQAFRERINLFMDTHPELIHFVPQALTAGDSQSREFALELADMSAHPQILSKLKEFMLGQQGPDDLRIKASQMLTKHALCKSGEMVDIWLKGQRTPLMMMGLEISYDPLEKPNLKPVAQRLMEQAIHALGDKDGEKAETDLRKALSIQGEEPSLLNNLALALSMQGKLEEADAIANEIPIRFPDYFFGQVIAIRRALQARQLEKARNMLDRLMQRTELHVTEFSGLCGCQIDFLIADGKPEGALSWFEIWKQGYPEDPNLERYEHTMAMIEALKKLKEGFPKQSRKVKKLEA